MKPNYKISRNQMLALCTVSFLAPALRLFPASSAQLAGRASWLSPLAALPFMLAYIYLLSKLMDASGDGEGLAELCVRVMGRKAGRAVVLLFAAWYLVYGGFVLRTGADRLITTVYPHTSSSFFVVSMGLLCLVAALCPLRSVMRTAKLCLPPVLGMLLLMLLFSFFSLDKGNLLPIGIQDIVPVLTASLSAINVMVGVLYSLCFLGGIVEKEPGRFRSYGLWACFAVLLLTLLNLSITGCFGPELAGRLTRPFFSLVRSLVFFSSIERLEALLVALWIFPDFLLISLVLSCAQHCLRFLWGAELSGPPPKLMSFSQGRWIIWLCCVSMIIIALFIAPDTPSMALWSKEIVPVLNLGFAFLVIPAIFITGKVKALF